MSQPGATAQYWFTKSTILISVMIAGFALFVAGPQLIIQADRSEVLPDFVRLTNCALYGFAGIFLLRFRPKGWSLHLACAFLLTAVSYSNPIIEATYDGFNPLLAQILIISTEASVEVFLAYQLWTFYAGYFQQQPRFISVSATIFRSLSLSLGVVLITVNLLNSLNIQIGLDVLLSQSRGNLYQVFAYVPLLLFFPYVLAMWKFSGTEDLKRIGVIILGSCFSVPALLVILMSATIPGFQQLVSEPGSLAAGLAITLSNIFLMLVPLTITYAVIALSGEDPHGNLSNRVLYRVSLLLIRMLLAIPLLGAFWYLYSMRDLQISELLQDSRSLLVLGCIAVFLAIFNYQKNIGLSLSALFHRQSFNKSEVFASLNRCSHEVRNIPELLQRTTTLLAEALSVIFVSAFTHDPLTRKLKALDSSNSDIELGDEDYRYLESHLASDSIESSFHKAAWVLTLHNSDSDMFACILIGRKRSEEKFKQEEIELIQHAQQILTSTANKLLELVEDESHDFLAPFEAARECNSCQRLFTPQQVSCPACGIPLELAGIPYLLNKKYHLLSRLGIGSFGKVYLGVDETLSRKVAIKCLPETASIEDRVYLKNEAKLMAGASHPNLAVVYGIEFWRNQPLLIVEYLPNGTLSAHLERKNIPLDLPDVITSLCRAVEYTHRQGVLHLDIKPSNIGFAKHMDIKLLDFGTAHLVNSISEAKGETDLSGLSMAEARETSIGLSLVGTPLYMSPQAHRGQQPDKSFDLWSLTVVILEILTGHHPFAYNSWPEAYASILEGRPDLSDDMKESFKQLVIERLLTLDIENRPQNAVELGELILDGWQ